jgi:hypothetical protein
MGLLGRVARGVAATAVVAGTATVVRNGVSRHQAKKWQQKSDAQAYEQRQSAAPQQQYPQAPPAPPTPASTPAPAAGSSGLVDQLQRLGSLKEQGLLSADEFTAAKNKLLGI